MKFSGLKKITTEDFPADQQEIANRLALILNPIVEQLITVFNKGVDFINLNRQLKSFSVKVTSTGAPVNTLQIKSELKTKAAGINVIRAVASNSISTVSNCPFISFTEESGLININNIQGLPANQEFNLTIEIIGENT